MTEDQPLRVSLDPGVADAPPWSDLLTAYDEQHLVTYMRLLDAETAGADWIEVTQVVLHRDAGHDHDGALRCWQAHLERAHWMTTHGYRHLLGRPPSPVDQPRD